MVDAAEAGRLLIASVHSVRREAAAWHKSGPGAEETDVAPDETLDEAKARALIERIARETYDEPA